MESKRAGMHIHAFNLRCIRAMWSQNSLTAPSPPLLDETKSQRDLTSSIASAGDPAKPTTADKEYLVRHHP